MTPQAMSVLATPTGSLCSSTQGRLIGGFLDTLQGLSGVMIGRSAAPDSTHASELRYEEALKSTLDALDCPVVFDLDIGHRPPQLVLINGALAQVSLQAGGGGQLRQDFV